MKISFIGYGHMAAALGGRWVGKHQLFVGGRDTAKAKALAEKFGHGTGSGSEADAAAFGEVIVLATTHEAVFDAMNASGGAAAFAGKVLIDINNPVPNYKVGDFLTRSYDGKSLAEAIAAAAPEAMVVKAFNMCEAKVWAMDPPVFDGRKLVVLFCGNDVTAKQKVSGLIEELGCDALDLGELKYARLLESTAAIVIKLLMSGHDSHTVLNLIQPEAKSTSR
jgi:predicted dinucleotide-binding enzyme